MKYSQAKECIKELGRSGFENLLKDYNEEVIEAALELDIQPANIAEAYQGEYANDEAFALDMADQLGSIDENAKWPNTYIDWERAARDLMMDYGEHNGHYFRNL